MAGTPEYAVHEVTGSYSIAGMEPKHHRRSGTTRGVGDKRTLDPAPACVSETGERHYEIIFEG